MRRMLIFITAILCVLALFPGCETSAGTYDAGTYTATAEGYSGDLTVEVEFDKDSILSVKVTDQNETAGFGDRAIEELTKKITEAQTYEVDAVTSATVTSDAIKAAVKNCVRQAERK